MGCILSFGQAPCAAVSLEFQPVFSPQIIGIVDDDTVSLSNLQRQVLHGTRDVGRPKLESARDRIFDVIMTRFDVLAPSNSAKASANAWAKVCFACVAIILRGRLLSWSPRSLGGSWKGNVRSIRRTHSRIRSWDTLRGSEACSCHALRIG